MPASSSVQACDPLGSLRPPLKWAGGKRWQVPFLRPYWDLHRHRRLVEPFCGGLAVTLGLMPGRALLNDVNRCLVHFYTWLRKGLVVTLPLHNSPATYYLNRSRFNRLLDDGGADTAVAAMLFYYLNRTGYNGLCRFNLRGRFNVPCGSYKTIGYRTDFLEYEPVFANWDFTATDFGAVALLPEDFVYADPPYDVEFTTYSQGGFAWQDQVRLARLLARHPGPVVLSNQATARIRELYGDLGYTLRQLDGPRRISCTGDRSPVAEVLATRNLAVRPAPVGTPAPA